MRTTFTFFASALFLIVPVPGHTEDISVWSAEGGYKNLDVTRESKGHYSIYDSERGTFLDAEVKDHGREVEVYDHDTGEYKTYDLEKQPGGGVEAYDSATGKYYDIDRRDAGKLMEKDHDCDHGSGFGDSGFGNSGYGDTGYGHHGINDLDGGFKKPHGPHDRHGLHGH